MSKSAHIAIERVGLAFGLITIAVIIGAMLYSIMV